MQIWILFVLACIGLVAGDDGSDELDPTLSYEDVKAFHLRCVLDLAGCSPLGSRLKYMVETILQQQSPNNYFKELNDSEDQLNSYNYRNKRRRFTYSYTTAEMQYVADLLYDVYTMAVDQKQKSWYPEEKKHASNNTASSDKKDDQIIHEEVIHRYAIAYKVLSDGIH